MADWQTTPDSSLAAAKSRAHLPWRVILPVAGFYLAWAGLAFLSHLAGRTTISPASAMLLIAAILMTNLLLAVLRLPGAQAQSAVVTAQAGLAITWSTVYAVLAEGPAELVPGMYFTAMLIAFARTSPIRLRRLAFAAAGGFVFTVIVRLLVTGSTAALWGEMLQGCAMIAMLALLVRRARQSENHRRDLSNQISRLQQEVERVSRNAERDHLTKSFNRQYIMDSLLREKARADRTGRSFSVCIFDLDRFKALNDRHGHIVGDRVLAAFASRAGRALRSMDAINPTRFRRALGRLGGEEFIAVLPGTEVDGALRCAERVRETVAREPVEHDLQITVSAGVAEYRQGESIPELLTRADQAMYQAKRSGRNRVRVSAVRPTRPRAEGTQKPTLRIVR
jgi:diguanylate cyclase (GGDEF)-like protein